MAVTQTDQGTSLKLVARARTRGRAVQPANSRCQRQGHSPVFGSAREIPDGWVELVEFGGFGTSDVAYLILPNKSRVVCASKVFGWFLVATRTEGFTVSQPITQESARRILAAVLSEEEVSRIWP